MVKIQLIGEEQVTYDIPKIRDMRFVESFLRNRALVFNCDILCLNLTLGTVLFVKVDIGRTENLTSTYFPTLFQTIKLLLDFKSVIYESCTFTSLVLQPSISCS